MSSQRGTAVWFVFPLLLRVQRNLVDNFYEFYENWTNCFPLTVENKSMPNLPCFYGDKETQLLTNQKTI